MAQCRTGSGRSLAQSPRRPARSIKLKELRDDSKKWLDWLLTTSQLAFIAFVLFGSFFVFAYLRSVGASIPAADLPGMTSLFLSISLLFGVLATGGILLALLPALTPWFLGKILDQPHGSRDVAPHGLKSYKVRAREALALHAAVYLFLLGVFAAVIGRFSPRFQLLAIGLSMSLGVALTTFWAMGSRSTDSLMTGAGGGRSGATRVAVYAIYSNLSGVLWATVVLPPALRLIPVKWQTPIDLWQDIVLFGLLVAIAMLHSLLTSINDRIRKIITAVAAALVLLSALWSPSSVGAATLRLLGVGGGMPVSVVLAPLPGAGSAARSEPGCLILESGSQIILRAEKQPGSASCADSRAAFSMRNFPYPGMLSSVEIVPAARVLRIGAQPSAPAVAAGQTSPLKPVTSGQAGRPDAAVSASLPATPPGRPASSRPAR